MEQRLDLSPAGVPLADIRDVSVDQNLPKEARISEFVRQIKNPYSSAAANSPSGPGLPATAPPWRSA